MSSSSGSMLNCEVVARQPERLSTRGDAASRIRTAGVTRAPPVNDITAGSETRSSSAKADNLETSIPLDSQSLGTPREDVTGSKSF